MSFIANSACYGLATLPASQNPLIKREILAALERTNIRYAESRDALRLLEANNASCLLLSSGKYLVTKEVAENGLGLLRAITHEDIEAIMQIMAREDRYKYQGIKELILKYFPPGEESDLPVELYVNHMVAKAFEWLALVENGVIFRNEVREGEEDFIGRAEKIINDNRHNYFTREFWDSAYRRDRIRDAVGKGMRFYQAALPEDAPKSPAAPPETVPDAAKKAEWLRIYPGHARAIERILESIKRWGILEGKAAKRTHGIGSSDHFTDDSVATVMLNPAFTGQRYSFERYSETDSSTVTAETDIFPTGPWLAATAMMGDRRVELLFSRTERRSDLIESLKKAPVEELERLWLEQILYSYGIGMLRVAQEGRYTTSEYGRAMGNAFSAVFVFRFNDVKERVFRISDRMVNYYSIYPAGEVDLKGGVPEDVIRYILVPSHLAKMAREAGFRGEILEVPMIVKNGESMPDYENALKEIMRKENGAPLLAHVARLPTPVDAIGNELGMINGPDDQRSREALIHIMTHGGPEEIFKAAKALAGIGDARAIGPLAVALTSGDRTREELATETLATMAAPEAREALWRALKNTHVKEKAWRYYYIAFALVKSGDLEAMPYLEKSISDIDIPFILRVEAIELIVKGLKSENGKIFRESLIRIIETISPFSMDEIVKALYEEDAAEAKSILFGEMQKVEGERLAALAIAIAEKTGDRDVIPYLERALQENEISHSLRMGRDSIEHALSLFSKNTPSSGEKTDLRTELSDQMRDMYDAGEFKILWLDLLDGSLEEGTVYKIKYDMSRLSDSQIAIIEEYASLLNKKTKSRFETIGCSSAKGSKESLISVYRQDKAGNVKGKGRVDIAIPERDSIDGYMLRIAGMLNIAVAESNIEENISSETRTPLLGFIRRQCQLIVSDSMAVPEDPAELIKFIHNIPLPKIYRMPTEKIEEYNRLARAALTAA